MPATLFTMLSGDNDMDDERLLYIDIYADTTGQYTEEEVFFCNCVRVAIPEWIIKGWFYGMSGEQETTFEKWYSEIYTCDDTDGLYSYAVERGFTPACGRNCDGWTWY